MWSEMKDIDTIKVVYLICEINDLFKMWSEIKDIHKITTHLWVVFYLYWKDLIRVVVSFYECRFMLLLSKICL